MKLLFFLFFIIFQLNLLANINLTEKEKEWIKNNSVKISMMDNFIPFSFIENNTHKGLTLDLLDKISKDTGLKFEIETSRWSQALDKFKNKQVDMIAGISHTKQRESFTLYTKPYHEIPVFIFGLKDDLHYIDNDSLIGKKVAVSNNLFYIPMLKQKGIEVVELDSSYDKAKSVITGKANYFLASYTTGIKSINNQSLTGLKVIDEFYDIKKEDLRFGIIPQKPILHSIMQKALYSIPASFMEKLSNKWIMFNNDNPNEKLSLTKKEKEFIKTHPIIKYSARDWQPIFSIENDQAKGIISDYLKIIEDRTGLKFQYIKTDDTSELHQKFDKSIINIIPSIEYNHIFSSNYLKSNYYVKYPMVIITDNQYKYIDKLHELDDKKIVMLDIPPAKKYIESKYSDVKITTVSNIPDALLLLENHEIDAFVGHIAPAIYYLNQLNQNDLKISGTVDFEYKHMFLIDSQNEELLSIINKAIDSIETYEKSDIYSKWIKSVSTEKIMDNSLLYQFGILFTIITIILVYRQVELRKINAKLKNSNYQIESILNSTLEGIIISENLKIAKVNVETMKILGYKNQEEIIGKRLYDVIAEDSKAKVRDRVESKNTTPYEVNLLKADGTIFPALAKGRDIILDDKTIRISSLVDISDMKNQEKLFLHQSKMAALGEMIGNIAHQWRQPLSLITTSASGLKLKKDYKILEDKDIDEISSSIIESANYLSKVIDDFDNYLKGEKKLAYFYVNDLIESILELEKELYKQNDIEIVFYNTHKIEINGYKSELTQALQYILSNAIDALNKKDQDKMIRINLYKDNNYLIIEIQDTAGGIPEDIIHKVYEPYFTTKHQSQGTGLGLYMTYNILKDMNSQIKVENKTIQYNSKDYQGANFKIKVPLNFESQNLQ